MPSHIYTRVGYWNESIASNAVSAKVAKADKEAGNQLHGQDYMVYAHLQLSQDKSARAVMDDMAATQNVGPGAFPSQYGLAASQARYMVERGDWKGAAELPVRPGPFNHTMAITHFARALGAARAGNPAAAKADIAKLAELRDKLSEAKDAYWSEIVDIQRQVAAAWVLAAEGKHDEALKAMSAAADAEDKTEKHPVTPGPLAPAREPMASCCSSAAWPRRHWSPSSHEGQGAKSLPRLRRRRASGREAGRQDEGQGELSAPDRAHVQGRFGAGRDRGRTQIRGCQLGQPLPLDCAGDRLGLIAAHLFL